CRHHRARFQGKCPLHRLFHLLHHGQHRRRRRTVCCRLGPRPLGRGKRFSHRGPQRFPYVLPGSALLSRTQTRRPGSAAKSREQCEKFPCRPFQPEIHPLPAHLHRLLDCLLAAVHFVARLHPHLHRSERSRRTHPDHRRRRGHLLHPRLELPHSKDSAVSCRDSRHAHILAV